MLFVWWKVFPGWEGLICCRFCFQSEHVYVLNQVALRLATAVILCQISTSCNSVLNLNSELSGTDQKFAFWVQLTLRKLTSLTVSLCFDV